MTLSRRHFLSFLGAWGAASVFLRPSALLASLPVPTLPKAGKYLLPLAEMSQTGYGRSVLALLDLENFSARAIPMPFYAHSLFPLPGAPELYVGVPKKGRSLALVDTKSQTARVSIEAEEGHVFFGHGATHARGKLLITGEHDEKSDAGVMVVRDPVTLKPVRRFPSYGGYPHECKFDATASTIRVVNSGYSKKPFAGKATPQFEARSHIAWIDPLSGKLLKRVTVEAPMVLSHFQEDKDRWLVSGGFQHDPSSNEGWGGIASFDPSGNSELMLPLPDQRAHLAGDAASLIIRERDQQAFVLSNRAHRLFRWNYRTGKLVSISRIGRSSSIAWVAEPDLALIWEMRSKQFRLISLETMKVLAHCSLPDVGGLRPGPHFLGPI